MPNPAWDVFCEQFQEDDGLPTRDSRVWAEEKLFAWYRYVNITTKAMVGKPQWSAGIYYVDLFAGPGICKLRSGRRIPGSPLIAAHAPKRFDNLLLCELNSENANACRQRLASSPSSDSFMVMEGDCNDVVHDIRKQIPKWSLTVAFIDPESLQIHFDSLRALTEDRRVDLLILFPDAMEVNRNVDTYYFPREDTKLDQVLGNDSDWRERMRANPAGNRRRILTDAYLHQIETRLGYLLADEVVIRQKHGNKRLDLYRLIYASRHQQGIDFWKKSVARELTDRSLF